MSIVDDLTKSGRDIHDAIDGLTTNELTHPGALGNWSIRDVIVHIAMWEGEVLKALAILRSGQKVDWSHIKSDKAISDWNDFWVENTKHLSAEKVIQLFDTIHSALVADVTALSKSADKKRKTFPEWLKDITVDHNITHIRKIKTYRKTIGR